MPRIRSLALQRGLRFNTFRTSCHFQSDIFKLKFLIWLKLKRKPAKEAADLLSDHLRTDTSDCWIGIGAAPRNVRAVEAWHSIRDEATSQRYAVEGQLRPVTLVMSSPRNPVRSACSERALIVFVRYPKVGTVKTRLAAGLGATAALELYKSFVSSILLESLRCTCKSRWIRKKPASGS